MPQINANIKVPSLGGVARASRDGEGLFPTLFFSSRLSSKIAVETKAPNKGFVSVVFLSNVFFVLKLIKQKNNIKKNKK